MKNKYYHHSRLIHFLISILFLYGVLYLIPTSLVQKVSIISISFLVGLFLGMFDWNKMVKRIDQRNVLIIYSSESVFYSLILFLFFAQVAPRAFMSVASHIEKLNIYIYISLTSLTGLFSGQTFIIWQQIRKYETENGRIIPRLFWTNSIMGEHGMISKKGVVLENCNPSGKVKIGSEIWNAESIDGKFISKQENIIVRDINGLLLIIEKSVL